VELDPLGDIVSRQYEQWMYPAPIFDIPNWLQRNWQWFDPSHSHTLFWPDRGYQHLGYQQGMDILVAGCGTNQAAVIAYTNPMARVVAIDVSDASLEHHRHLVTTHALENLELHRLPIERVGELDRDFDLIISTGVLHHMANPDDGLSALAACLRVGGVLAVMLYATYGRLGVQMMQSTFRDMGLTQDEPSIALVRDAIAQLDPGHPLATYLDIASDLADDAGLVDTFLHGRERTFTVDECQELVASAGLVFQDMFLKAPYYAPRNTTSAFLASVADLPKEQQWSIMERLNPRNACHYFLACHPERPTNSYAIDFSSNSVNEYMPSLRHACRLEHQTIYRYNWELQLDPVQAALVSLADGHTTISLIVQTVFNDAQFPHLDDTQLSAVAIDTFQMLWQLDFLAMGISTPDPTPIRRT
jgi:SAM-dependent methyltransferase